MRICNSHTTVALVAMVSLSSAACSVFNAPGVSAAGLKPSYP